MTSTPPDTRKRGEKLPSKQCMLELFETGYLSDVTLKIGDHEVKAHQSVLAAKSPWFVNAFEKFTKESKSPTVTLPEPTQYSKVLIQPITASIRFCYTGQYSYTESLNHDEKEPNIETMEMLQIGTIMGQKYGIDGLVEHCTERYIGSTSVLFSKRSEDEVFDFIQTTYKMKLWLPSNRNMILVLSLNEFNRRITTLQAEGKFQEAFERMRANPKASADFLEGVTSEDGKLVPAGEWNCTSCAATFRYTKTAIEKRIELLDCPCCVGPGKRFVEARPAPPVKKTGRDP